MIETRERLDSLQVFRGLAALIVILYHVTAELQRRVDFEFLWGLFNFGGAGVDFFFVLSGFVIVYVHWEDVGRRDQFWRYLVKRLIRIYPVYWIILGGVVTFNFIFVSISLPEERELGNILMSFLLIPQSHMPVLGVAWTLSHEMFFYICFGLLIACRQRYIRWLVIGIVIASLITYVTRIIQPSVFYKFVDPYYIVKFMFSHHNIEFALGAAAAGLQRRYRIPFAKTCLFGGVVMFVASGANEVYWQVGLFDKREAYRIIYYGLPSFLLVLGGVGLDKLRIVQWYGPLKSMGDASYSLYLVHYPIIVVGTVLLLETRVPPGQWPAILLAGVFLVGYGVHYFLEKPMLDFGKTWIRENIALRRPIIRTHGSRF